MSRRPPPTPPKLQRALATVTFARPPMIVVCEGKTEEQLLNALKGRWRITKLKVQVKGSQGDPRNVVRVAGDRVRADARHGVEVWAVFDRDEHAHWSGAIDQARALGIDLAISNPCFELWAILLHRDHTAHIHRHEAQRRLKRLHKGYDHARSPYLDVDVVLGALELAEQRCALLSRTAVANGDPHGNPSSTFSTLVSRIRGLATD